MPVCAVYGCKNSTNINRKRKGVPDNSKITVTKEMERYMSNAVKVTLSCCTDLQS
jgi:hypothetical protein